MAEPRSSAREESQCQVGWKSVRSTKPKYFRLCESEPLILVDPDGRAPVGCLIGGGIGSLAGGAEAIPGCGIGTGVQIVGTIIVAAILTVGTSTPAGDLPAPAEVRQHNQSDPATQGIPPEGPKGPNNGAWVAATVVTAGVAAATMPDSNTQEKPSSDYRETFFAAHPELRGYVWVHHSIEQQVLKRYPGLFTETELDALERLRGVPNNLNSEIHLSGIRTRWNEFYRTTPNATRQQVIDFAKQLYKEYGKSFAPVME